MSIKPTMGGEKQHLEQDYIQSRDNSQELITSPSNK